MIAVGNCDSYALFGYSYNKRLPLSRVARGIPPFVVGSTPLVVGDVALGGGFLSCVRPQRVPVLRLRDVRAICRRGYPSRLGLDCEGPILPASGA